MIDRNGLVGVAPYDPKSLKMSNDSESFYVPGYTTIVKVNSASSGDD
jgi:hypothetical protein